MADRTVLVTGAAGRVATMLRPGLDDVRVRAVDLREVPAAAGDEFMVGDVAQRSFAAAAVDGVDAVVHLAANPAAYASWDDLRSPNVEAIVAIIDAARDAGVRRFVFASSVHAMGGYTGPGDVVVDPVWPVRPCCGYGATKAFGEAYGNMTAATSELSMISLRLGAVQPRPVDTGALTAWLSAGDLQQLVRCAIDTNRHTGTYFGVSANGRNAFSNANARTEIGYRPRDNADDHSTGLPDGNGGMCRLAHPSAPPSA